MSQMNRPEPWFLAQRAELLAIVTLTRVPGLTVQRQTMDHGVDLLAFIPGERWGRVFGVEVKAGTKRDAYITGDGKIRDVIVKNLDRLAGDSPFPVGVLFFDMSDDSGYFGWLLAPSTTESGEPRLERHLTVPVNEVSDEYLHKIVQDVTRWYEARATRS